MTMRTLANAVLATSIGMAGWGPPDASGQDAPHAHGAPGERLGAVHFATSCAPDVQPAFDRGVALLHSFWFSAAIESFEGVLARDPRCVLAHWGIAMSWWGNPFASARPAPSLVAGRAAIDKALATGAGTARERAWLAAADLLFRAPTLTNQRARVVAYTDAMGGLAASHPDDVEARIFHALALTQSALPTDKTYGNQLAAAAILEKEFARQPEHPGLAHYIIHTFDVPALAPRALDAARRYAAIAPDAPHALHMPSHTFTRVGSWQESIDTNLASAAAARKDKATAEELHALDYQAYAYLQTGQDAAARRTVDAVPALAPSIDLTGAGNAAPASAGYYAAAAIPARYALEREDWTAAASLAPRETPYAWTDAVTRFARAIGAARRGDTATASAEVARLQDLKAAVTRSGDTYWAGQVDIQRRAASAWVLLLEGNKEGALSSMREAAVLEDATEKAAVTPGPLKPARELLGDMLMALERPAEALVEYEATLVREPRRFRATYGAARAAAAASQPATARDHYARLLEIAERADPAGRPELDEARQALTRVPVR